MLLIKLFNHTISLLPFPNKYAKNIDCIYPFIEVYDIETSVLKNHIETIVNNNIR
jgi:hypothetical protein